MANIFFASDHHIDHQNILTFTRSDGTRLRDFESLEHMQEHIVAKHNSVVGKNDKVYFLGDFAMSHKAQSLEILRRMNGSKVLIKGNHDLCKPHAYLEHFKDIRAVHQFEGVILTHIPIHTQSLARWGVNIHGHLHSNQVTLDLAQIPDRRYFNVSMEAINYTPISLEQVKAKVRW